MATDPHPIGLKIKRARERLLMSQAELGARVRKSQKTIDNWEHNRSYPKSSIGALEDVLGISLDGEPEPEAAIPPGILALIRRHYPPEQQAQAIEALTAIGADPGGEGEEAESEPGREAGLSPHAALRPRQRATASPGWAAAGSGSRPLRRRRM